MAGFDDRGYATVSTRPHGLTFHENSALYEKIRFTGMEGSQTFFDFCRDEGGYLFHRDADARRCDEWDCVVRKSQLGVQNILELTMWVVSILAILVALVMLGYYLGQIVKAFRQRRKVREGNQQMNPPYPVHQVNVNPPMTTS